MNLTFLNPFFLFGLAAGAIPILIHRLTQRKAIPRKFSAVRLLLQSQRVMARPQRLKHLLLLVLRILAIAGLSFMMARPILVPKGLFALGKEKANVLILDNSLSMGYGEENGERYEVAKRAAQEVLQALKGQVILIPTVAVPEKVARWMSPEEAVKELPKIPLSFGKGDPGASLRLGYQKLDEMKVPGEILFFSDMAQGDWEGFHLSELGTLSSDKGITFLRI